MHSGAISLLTAPLTNSDILLQINTVELIGSLCKSPHAVPYLLKTGTLKQLLVLAGAGKTAPDPFLGGGALTIFCAFRWAEEVIPDHK